MNVFRRIDRPQRTQSSDELALRLVAPLEARTGRDHQCDRGYLVAIEGTQRMQREQTIVAVDRGMPYCARVTKRPHRRDRLGAHLVGRNAARTSELTACLAREQDPLEDPLWSRIEMLERVAKSLGEDMKGRGCRAARFHVGDLRVSPIHALWGTFPTAPQGDVRQLAAQESRRTWELATLVLAQPRGDLVG